MRTKVVAIGRVADTSSMPIFVLEEDVQVALFEEFLSAEPDGAEAGSLLGGPFLESFDFAEAARMDSHLLLVILDGFGDSKRAVYSVVFDHFDGDGFLDQACAHFDHDAVTPGLLIRLGWAARRLDLVQEGAGARDQAGLVPAQQMSDVRRPSVG
jgi:hypothetical protein